MRTLRIIGLAVALAVLGTAPVSGGNGGKVSLHGGVEWGYSMTGYEWYHYNYLGMDGQRRNPVYGLHTIGWNAGVSVYGELCLWDRFALRAAGGYAGIYTERMGWTAAARGSYFFKGYKADTPLVFVEGAKVFLPSLEGQNGRFARVGGGYRLALAGWLRIDLLFSVQYTEDHPDRYYDRYQQGYVVSPELRRSDVGYATLNLGFALNF